MLKALNWSLNEDEKGYKEFMANVAQMHFNSHSLVEPYDLIMNYLIIKIPDNDYELYFDCNGESFNLGGYTTFGLADIAANNHHEEFFYKQKA